MNGNCQNAICDFFSLATERLPCPFYANYCAFAITTFPLPLLLFHPSRQAATSVPAWNLCTELFFRVTVSCDAVSVCMVDGFALLTHASAHSMHNTIHSDGKLPSVSTWVFNTGGGNESSRENRFACRLPNTDTNLYGSPWRFLCLSIFRWGLFFRALSHQRYSLSIPYVWFVSDILMKRDTLLHTPPCNRAVSSWAHFRSTNKKKNRPRCICTMYKFIIEILWTILGEPFFLGNSTVHAEKNERKWSKMRRYVKIKKIKEQQQHDRSTRKDDILDINRNSY